MRKERLTTANDIVTKTDSLIFLQLCLKHPHILLSNSDTLFLEDFSLKIVEGKFSELLVQCADNSLVLSYQCKEEGELSFHTTRITLKALRHRLHIWELLITYNGRQQNEQCLISICIHNLLLYWSLMQWYSLIYDYICFSQTPTSTVF